MNKHYLVAAGEHYVGFARQVFTMKPEPIAIAVEKRSDLNLRLRVGLLTARIVAER